MVRLLRDEHGDIHPVKLFAWVMLSILAITPISMVIWNTSFVEGVPVTVQGKVQIHELRYDKFWEYDWTFIEFQTFSDHARHYEFLGHIDLELGVAYRVRFTRRSLLGHHIWMYNEVLDFEKIMGDEG